MGGFGEVFAKVLAGSGGFLGALGTSQRVLDVLDRFTLFFPPRRAERRERSERREAPKREE